MALIPYDVSGVPSTGDATTWSIVAQNGASAPERDHDREYTFYSADELGQFPPVEWLIPGWIAADELTALYGLGDTYKSFIALDISCQLAAAGQTVLYIAAEGMSGLKARVAAWMVCHQIPSLPQLLVMGTNLDVHQQPQRDRWATEVEMETSKRELPSPELVVVDTLARNFVGGDENYAKDMGEFVEGCEAIRRRFEAAVLVLHHTTKDGKSERGNESLRNASFAMLKTSRKKLARGKVKVECDRMKDAEPPRPVVVAFQTVDLSRFESLPATSLALPDSFPPATTSLPQDELRAAVLDILGIVDEPVAAKEILRRARKRGVKIAQNEGVSLLRAWAQEGVIEHDPKQGYRLPGDERT